MRHPKTIQGFSLVELSIVLVILGLLTGGILAGQSLIRAAEWRASIAQSRSYMTAIYTFRDKYMGVPGDISNATKFWGSDTGTACSNSPVAGDRVAKTLTCDGNGNGAIGDGSYNYEAFRLWQQLANAGLIEGSYTGVTGPNSTVDPVAGQNVPMGKIAKSSFSFRYLSADNADLFAGTYGNLMTFGQATDYWSLGALFKPEEVWNLDTKLDDGKPAIGKVRSRHSYAGVVSTCLTSTSASTAEYSLNVSDPVCAIVFLPLN